MRKNYLNLIIAGTVFVFAGLIAYPRVSAYVSLSHAPFITLVQLDGQTLKFSCLDNPRYCYPSINLERYLKFKNTPDSPIAVTGMFFASQSSIYLTFTDGTVIHIDPVAHRIRATELPKLFAISGFHLCLGGRTR